MLAGGGGCFGRPYKREPAPVADDVREGYVSREAALKACTESYWTKIAR